MENVEIINSGDEMNNLEVIKRNLERNIGNKITIKYNRGRKKKDFVTGILENTYQSIFVVRFLGDYNKIVSFTYTDIFTKNIELEFDNAKKVSNE